MNIAKAMSIVFLVVALAGVSRADSADRTVDLVTAGEEQNERDHKLKGEQTETLTFNNRVYRTAGTNGWFAWELKVQPAEPQELSVKFGGKGAQQRPERVEVLVDGVRLATVPNNGAPRQEFYSLNPDLLKGKAAVTVRFQPAAGSRVIGVHNVTIAKPPLPTIASTSKASSPRTTYPQIVNAINDLREPESSSDRWKKHFDWWPAKGTNQWVQYDFAKPARVSAVEVYWFDDTGIGECRPPKSWRVLYRANGEWKPVAHAGPYGCEKDHYNRVTFDAVETDGLRLDVELPERFSSGLLQWRVE